MSTKELGQWGERYTADQMEGQGYRIITRNFHSHYGEIDLIAQNEKFLVFVEVKTRSSNALDRPSAWVTPQKQRKIIKTAQLYLLQHPTQLQPRFDVAEVVVRPGPNPVAIGYQYIEGAFYVETAY